MNKEFVLKFLDGKISNNQFVREYVAYRKKDKLDFLDKVIGKNTSIINGRIVNKEVKIIDIIIERKLDYIVKWCLNNFNINEIIKDGKTIYYG